uniref:uncharacterized protein LOC122596601 n=1 Tax=Erigeron canadensis TaxID=72917 RepID=UPI001CB93E2E|nr:uncharacterized protein LOC122596601 [Erigeron canadensis]
MPSSKSAALGITKQKPMKRRKNNKHSRRNKLKLINKIASYLISDPYLYSPLVAPQPTFDFPPPKPILFTPQGDQEDVALPTKKTKSKSFMEKVIEFLEADCFLYSPLVTKSDHVVDTNSVSGYSQTTKGNGRTEAQGNRGMEALDGGVQHLTQEGRDVSRSLGTKPVVKTAVSYHESVKHMVRPNYRTRSNQGV